MTHPINIIKLSHSFGNTPLLKEISFEVPEGQAIALLGQNGAGKTTLIKMMTGLLKPQKGCIELFGENPLNLSSGFLPEVRFVSENRNLYPWLTIKETLHLASSLHSQWDKKQEERLLLELNLNLSTKVGVLSKGEKGKLHLLIALATNPKLLIMDEPTAGLDPLVRRTFMKHIVDLMLEEGKTIFYSTHEITEAERLAQRIAILHNGEIALFDSLDKIRNSHRKIKAKINTIIPEISDSCNVRVWENNLYMDVLHWNPEKENQIKNSDLTEIEIIPATLEDVFCMIAKKGEK